MERMRIRDWQPMQTDIKFPRLNVQFVILTEFDMLITNCIQASVSLNEPQINHISTSIQTSKEMRRSFIEKDTFFIFILQHLKNVTVFY